MSQVIWNNWVPGVLSPNQIRQLCKLNHIDLGEGISVGDVDIDESSIDLHLTDEAYVLTSGSVKPFGDGYLSRVKDADLVRRIEPEDPDQRVFYLENGSTYLFRLRERLHGLCGEQFFGQATARSSVGRVDVLARLIVDGMTHYEGFDPSVLNAGHVEMYLEVTPITFPVRVKAGKSLSQLRFFYGRPENCELRGEEIYKTCFETHDRLKLDNSLSVEISPTEVYGKEAVAFVAEASDDKEPIDLWGKGGAKPSDYWDVEMDDGNRRLQIETGKFYILRSKERIALPSGVAVYARAIDEAIGEMRIHYAGFVHPFFGRDRSDGELGTPLIFEVRGHNVDVNLRDGETMARLRFYRMSEDIQQAEDQDYGDQTLKLSKYFDSADW